jgi:ATP-dependent RNA helicase RhlE
MEPVMTPDAVQERSAPADAVADTQAADPEAFARLGVGARLLEGVAGAGYDEPTPIQEHAIPVVLQGRDVVGCAQTGTGKTAAFMLPILELMERGGRGAHRSEAGDGHPEASARHRTERSEGRLARAADDRRPKAAPSKGAVQPRALVVTPTRELAAQIEEVGVQLARATGRRIQAVFGGVPYGPQQERVRRGVDLLVATPGRLLDMVQRGDIHLGAVATLVLDEADRMLDMGFWPDVRRIVRKLPEKRQNLFFSATMSKAVLNVIEDTLHRPVFIELGGRATPVESIDQRVLPVARDQKLDLLVEYFRQHDPSLTLVFARTRHRADRLARTLNHKGVACAAIHGDRSQGQRQQALDGFKRGRIKVLVATDIVARGIDVDGISHVVNYDVPSNPEDYVHRIGRTARAGASGAAVTIVTEDDVYELRAIERLIGVTLPRHDLEGFAYEPRAIPPSDKLPPVKRGKLVWNGGALRSAQRGFRARPPRRR